MYFGWYRHVLQFPSNSPPLLKKYLRIILKATFTNGITVNFLFHSLFSFFDKDQLLITLVLSVAVHFVVCWDSNIQDPAVSPFFSFFSFLLKIIFRDQVDCLYIKTSDNLFFFILLYGFRYMHIPFGSLSPLICI